MNLSLIISGGQAGADQGAWRAASRGCMATAGMMPPEFRTEEGPRPEFAREFGAVELPDTPEARPGDHLRERTRLNVSRADATLLFGDPGSPGGRLALSWLDRLGKPRRLIPDPLLGPHPLDVAAWIDEGGYSVVNCAGNRESSAPGIGAWVEEYLGHVLELLKGGALVEWLPDDGPGERLSGIDLAIGVGGPEGGARRGDGSIVEDAPVTWTLGRVPGLDRFAIGTGSISTHRLDGSGLASVAYLSSIEPAAGRLVFRAIAARATAFLSL